MKEGIQMESLYKRANLFYKEHLYQLYFELVDKPMQYERITRRKLLEEIHEYYSKEDHLFDLLSPEEISILKEIIDHKENILTENNQPILESLASKYIIDYSYYTNELFIYDEYKEDIVHLLEKAKTPEGQKILQVQEIAIGLCNAFGALEEEDFFETVCQYIGGIRKEEVQKIIYKTHNFGNRITTFEYPIDDEYRTIYSFPDEDLVYDFLESFSDVLSLPKYEFSYDELKEYSIYGLHYSNETLQILIEKFKSSYRYLDVRQFCLIIKHTHDLLLDNNIIKKYIYEHYPHYNGDTEEFFELMDLVDELIPNLNTWAARGYPINEMTEMISGMQVDVIKRMENAYRNKTGLAPEDDLNAFLDFMESFTDEMEDYVEEEIDDKKLN